LGRGSLEKRVTWARGIPILHKTHLGEKGWWRYRNRYVEKSNPDVDKRNELDIWGAITTPSQQKSLKEKTLWDAEMEGERSKTKGVTKVA